MIILKALSLIFIFAIFVAVFFVFTVISNIRTLFNLRRKTSQGTGSGSTTHQSSSYDRSNSADTHVYNTSARRKGKIIPDDEGEYVDFEEIK